MNLLDVQISALSSVLLSTWMLQTSSCAFHRCFLARHLTDPPPKPIIPHIHNQPRRHAPSFPSMGGFAVQFCALWGRGRWLGGAGGFGVGGLG